MLVHELLQKAQGSILGILLRRGKNFGGSRHETESYAVSFHTNCDSEIAVISVLELTVDCYQDRLVLYASYQRLGSIAVPVVRNAHNFEEVTLIRVPHEP